MNKNALVEKLTSRFFRKGEGLPGNKRAKSSFKQNKRHGL